MTVGKYRDIHSAIMGGRIVGVEALEGEPMEVDGIVLHIRRTDGTLYALEIVPGITYHMDEAPPEMRLFRMQACRWERCL